MFSHVNTTDHPADEMDTDAYFSQTLGLIQSFIYIPIFCAGIANNFLTVVIILLNRDMRTVTNFYLLNLAISDMLPLIVSLPFEISVRSSLAVLTSTAVHSVA